MTRLGRLLVAASLLARAPAESCLAVNPDRGLVAALQWAGFGVVALAIIIDIARDAGGRPDLSDAAPYSAIESAIDAKGRSETGAAFCAFPL
jgi:hypothetical protein